MPMLALLWIRSAIRSNLLDETAVLPLELEARQARTCKRVEERRTVAEDRVRERHPITGMYVTDRRSLHVTHVTTVDRAHQGSSP
jgi:hypothetical protein